MKTRTFSRWMALAACAAAAASSVAAPANAGEANKACALLTQSELVTVLGDTVTLRPQDGMEGVAICSGETPKATVMLRLAPKRGDTGSAEKAGIEIARKTGAQVDVKTFGSMACSTVVPPESLASYGFSTTCALTKGTSVAAIEVTVKTRNDMVSIERLKPVAGKMAGRF